MNIRAERYEPNAERVNQVPRTPVGYTGWTLDLKIPKLLNGSYFPSLLEPRKLAEKALLTVV